MTLTEEVKNSKILRLYQTNAHFATKNWNAILTVIGAPTTFVVIMKMLAELKVVVQNDTLLEIILGIVWIPAILYAIFWLWLRWETSTLVRLLALHYNLSEEAVRAEVSSLYP